MCGNWTEAHDARQRRMMPELKQIMTWRCNRSWQWPFNIKY